MVSVNVGSSTSLGLANICATQLLHNDNAFSGMSVTPYSWQVPSYPMFMTLTGGIECESDIGTTGNCNAAGFSAISSPVPAFDSSTNGNTAYLWSSSLGVFHDTFVPWQFFGNERYGNVQTTDLSDYSAVRCVSLAW